MRIGFIGPLSGSSYAGAHDLIDGFRLGAKALGGKLGGLPYLMGALEDHGAPEAAKAAYQQFTAGPGAHLVLLDSSRAAADALSQLSVVGSGIVLNLGAADPRLAGTDCSANFFSLVPPRDEMHALVGRYLQNTGVARVALVGMQGQGTVLPALRAGYAGEVTDIKVRPGEMGFNSVMIALRAVKPQAVYLTLEAGVAANFLRQFDAAGLDKTVTVYGPAELLDRPLRDAAGGAAQGVYTVAPWSADLDSAVSKKMVADFAAEYGRAASYQGALGYQTALLIDAAIKRGGVATAEGLRDGLRHAAVAGPLPDFRFDDDQFPRQSYLLRQAVLDPHGDPVDQQRAVLARDLRLAQPGTCAMQWTESAPAPTAKAVRKK